MSRIKVTICTGTTCYVMGSGNLISIKEHLGDELAEIVDIEGSTCLELCKNDEYGRAPYVKVNDTVIAEATMTKIAEEIRRQAD